MKPDDVDNAFELKVITGVDGQIAIRRLTARCFENVRVHECWSGPATVERRPTAQAPVYRLPVRAMLDGCYWRCDFVLPYGRVLHDYATANAIRSAGGQAEAFAAELSRAAEVQAYVAHALACFSRIDFFFNNAGIEGVVAPTTDYPEEVFDRVVAVNLKGVFLGLKYVLPHVIKQGAGAVINMASVAGVVGSAGMSAYSASKHAIIGLTRTAAAEVGRSGVRVNAVCASAVQTRMIGSLEKMINPDNPQVVHAQFVARNPTGRYCQPEEVAQVVVFLASPAASFVNGVAMLVDGGRTAI